MPPFVNFSSFQSSEQPIGPIGYTGSASTVPGPIGYTGSTGAGYTGSAGSGELHPFMFIQGI